MAISWQSYDVNVDERVYYMFDLRYLLYFIPLFLLIKVYTFWNK
ncbi:hypothetical protein TDB9533_04779 [Thalassocella blandensis]|nr:hypothetical protein TDB9533_04779 [Thalassocella blandensis]